MDTTTEQTPLLSSEPETTEEEQATIEHEPRHLFFLSLALIFLLQAGLAIPVAPTTSILEKLICQRLHYDEDSCKGEAVQAELAMLKGMAAFFLLLPGCFLVVPFGLLADRVGAQRVLMLSILGIWLADAWYALVCWYGQAWPLQLLWLSPVFYLIGGGSTVFISLLFVFVANISPPHLRTARFFQLEASAYLGNILSYLASSVLMDRNPWIPVLLGLVLLALTGCLLVVTVRLGPAKKIIKPDQPDQVAVEGGEGEQESVDLGPLSVKTFRNTISAIRSFITTQKLVVALLFGYFLRMLGVCVSRLELIYISKRLDWSIARAAYLISLDSAVHLAVLLLLPGVTSLLLFKFSFSSLKKDIFLARLSIIFSVVGCAGLALSPTPWSIVISIIIYGLGAGYGSSIRGVVTSITSSQHRALLYSIMSMLDVIGTFIGTPLWPSVYRFGLKLGGIWTGLPFGIAAITLAVVSLTVEISYFTGRA